MKGFKLMLTTLLCLLIGISAAAQRITVSGTVRDAEGPLVGAYVSVQGTTNSGTVTDFNGDYSISVPSNATLVFQMIGYADQAVEVAGRTKINVIMKIDSTVLEETIVIGYGSAKKVGNLTGSVTTVSSEKIKNAPAASALDKLQGQVAGLSVLTTGGVAGDNNVSMTLHGVGSLNASSAPLYIIDGVPSSSRTVMSLNPNDILNISVLKDASATSIYGARAANGVIVITTRGGQFSSKASITIRSQYGISTLADMTLYENMMRSDELVDFWIRSGINSPEAIYNTYTQYGYTADVQWWRHSQRFNNPQYQNDIIIEGGSDKVAYMVGASQYHQRGNTHGNFYDRYTVRSNIQGAPKKWLKLGMNMNISLEKNRTNANWGSSGSNANYTYGGLSYLLNPLYPFIDPVTGKEYEIEYPNGMPQYAYYSEMIKGVATYYNLLGSAYVQIEPIRNLKFRSQLGTDATFLLYASKRNPKYFTQVGNGARSKENYLAYTNTINNTIEYSFDLGEDHQFSALLGQEGVAYEYDMTYAYGRELTDERLMILDLTTQDYREVEEDYAAYKFLSFFGHADYTFRDRYIADITVRNDGSSRFGANHRHGTFWSFGALWKINKENFLLGNKNINALNFKVSYGTQGNAGIGNYQSLALVGSSSAKFMTETGKALVQAPNPDLTWERQSLLTFTVSGRVFDRFDFDLEYYNRRTDDMLLSVPQPYTTGFGSIMKNVGAMTNNGIDISLGVDILKGRDYYLRASTNFSVNKEKITRLFGDTTRWELANTGITYVVGQAIHFYEPIWAGIDPENGKQMWYLPKGVEEVQDADGTYHLEIPEGFDESNRDVTTMDPDRVTYNWYEEGLTQNTGYKLHVPMYGGFSIGGGWKGLSLQADFSYVVGKYLLNNDMYFYANPAQNNTETQHKMVTDFWTPTHTNARFPDWSTGETMHFDTHLIEKADFLRLKNLQIGYNLPAKALAWSKGVLSDVRLSFTGRNLFILTEYSGIDPEVDSNLSYGTPGNSKQFLFGVEVTF